jgi:hypothetical protein
MDTPSKFLERALVWVTVAGAAGLRWQEVLGWGFGGAAAERAFGFRLEAVLLRWAR